MAEYKVLHNTFGDGTVIRINEDHVVIQFESGEKNFLLKDLDKYCQIQDDELEYLVQEAKSAAETAKPSANIYVTSTVKSGSFHPRRESAENSLLGPNSKTIDIPSENEMYVIIGYLAKPGRLISIEAEVPMDGRDQVFEEMYPGQVYRPIKLADTPSGMSNKLSPQFRINFADLTNCPTSLKSNMGKGNASCVGRINKSRFVIDLVQNYGFKFGYEQDFKKIKGIAERNGFLEDFERGLSL